MSGNNRALQVLSNLPATPGRQVKYLREELEKKDNENLALKNNVTDLTKALTNLKIVTDKVNGIENVAPNSTAGSDNKRKFRNKDAPVAAKTAYKYYCEDRKEESAQKDMRLLWKEFKGEERQKYVDLAAQDKIRFENENALYQKVVSEKKAEEDALKMYYDKQKQELAMEFYEAHLVAQSTLPEKNKKKIKDPDAPKGIISSYLFFCQDKRESLTKKHPETSPTEMSKMLGEEWNKLKASKRGTKKYDTMAEKDKQRYLQEKKAYDVILADRNLITQQEKQSKLDNDKLEAMKLMKEMQTRHDDLISQQDQTSEQGSEIPAVVVVEKQKKKKDPNAPKAPKSSYIFFCQEKREIVVKENPGIKPTDVLKKLGEEWSKIKGGNTDKYDKLAAADKIRYEGEKKVYDQNKQ